MIIDMYNLGKAFVESGGNLGSADLTEEQKRLAFLTEPHQPGTPLFVLWQDETGTARLDQQEVRADQSYRLPFIKVAPNAAYLTPVFKADVKKGLQASKRNTTLKRFENLATTNNPSAPYFQRIVDALTATTFRSTGDKEARVVEDAFSAVVEVIVRAKLSGRSPIICVASDADGKIWPGDDVQFVHWLLNARERLSIYETKSVPNIAQAICPLSGESGELFTNGLTGAGLNFVNGDFEGSFSELSGDRAWQRAAVSASAADMLYIYKNHVAQDFLEYIAGSKALVIPAANAGAEAKRQFVKGMKRLMEQGHTEGKEGRLLEYLAEDDGSVASVTLLWASFAQKFEEATGMITHVLPSRLAELNRIQAEYNKSTDMFHPKHADLFVRRLLDLKHSLATELIYRPGGATVKAQNASPQRHNLLRELFAAVYHRHLMVEDNFWKQIAQTARAYVVMLLEQNDSSGVVFQLRHEGANAPKKRTPLTVNGWIRHLTMFLSYLADPRIGVFAREDHVYEPTQEGLKPLLAQAKGLNNAAKQFTFLLGVLYGHLIYVQAEKAKVSVASNALSWLRSGRIRSADLPELYAKISSKLLEYHSLGIAKKFLRLHEIETELAQLGTTIGDEVSSRDLPDDKVLYFLMLGMSMSYTFTFTEKPENPKNGDAQ
jgi:CRISPR-associated protein Csh1